MNQINTIGGRQLVTIRNKDVKEPLAYHGIGITATFPISYLKASQLVGCTDIQPARLTRRLSLVNVVILDFHTTPFGPYTEAVFSIPVLHKPKLNCPFLPLLFHQRIKGFGFRIVDIAYSTEAAATGGVLLAEGPHNQNLIRIERDHSWKRVSVWSDDGEVLTLETSRTGKPRPVHQTYTTYVTNAGQLVRIRMAITGNEAKIGSCRLTVRPHRLSQVLRDLDVSPRAVEARLYSNLTELFPVSLERL